MRATKMLVSMSLALIMLATMYASADTGCEAVDTSLNKPPKVVNVSYVIKGKTVYFTAIIKDDEHSKHLREVVWEFGDGTVEKKYGGWTKVNETKEGGTTYYVYEMSVSHTYKDYRQYSVRIVVRDLFNLNSTYGFSVQVTRSNEPPLVELESVEPNPAKPGEKVTFLARASDPDGRVTTFYWDFGDGQRKDGANLTKVTHVYSSEGTYTVTVRVKDDKGEYSNTASVKVYVKSVITSTKIPNRAPIITSVVFTPSEPTPGATISFKASAYDPDGDPITYAWDFGDGTVKRGGAEMKYSYPKEGAYTVKVKVTDSNGLESLYTVSVAVRGNKPPQASIVSIKAIDGASFLFQGMGIDPDGQVVAYEWRMGDGKTFTGELEGNSIPHKYINYTYSRSGNYTVSFRVRDKEGAWSNWVSERISVRLPEKFASAAVSWLGFDNIWVTAGVGATIVLFASYLALRDSRRNSFIERANSSRKIVVKRGQAWERRDTGPRYYYRDHRSYARRGSRRAPWD